MDDKEYNRIIQKEFIMIIRYIEKHKGKFKITRSRVEESLIKVGQYLDKVYDN